MGETSRTLKSLAVLLLAAAAFSRLCAQAPFPAPPRADRVRLAEAMRVADGIRADLWPGWEAIPGPILLVTDSAEYLLRHPRPSADFTSLGRDSLLRTEVWARSRIFPLTLLATFPAVGGIPTVVVGSAERTGKSSVGWVLTLMHEHFHQWQYSEPGYYPELNALNLARGDTTGMWALQFPFPYDSMPVQQAMRGFAEALVVALDTSGVAEPVALAPVRGALDRLLDLLAPDDRRYLEFQLWQEGVARWVEYAAARSAARLSPPLAAFLALPDYLPYGSQLVLAEAELRWELRNLDVGRDQRTVFYPLGAALALLTDRQGHAWKRRYAMEKFQLSGITDPAP